MEPRKIAQVCLLVWLILLVAGPLFSDEQTINYAGVVVESFDNPAKSQWVLEASKFASKDFPQIAFANAWPSALYGTNKEQRDLRALGIHGKFDRKGYNYIEIVPVAEGSDGSLAATPLKLPGRTHYLSLWVWGSNYDYYLDAHVRDFQGIDHVLPLGSLKFEGWRALSVSIPTYIPQAQNHVPKLQGLELTKLVLWTRPGEAVDGFFVYLDELKVLTDMFETRFDGDDLIDTDKVQAIWKKE